MVRQKRSIHILSLQRPLPSIEIRIWLSVNSCSCLRGGVALSSLSHFETGILAGLCKKSQSIVNWPTLCNKRSFWAFNCFNSRLSSWGVSNTLPACCSNASRHLLVRFPIVIPTSRDRTSIKSRRGRLRTRTSLRSLMTLFLEGQRLPLLP